jgi:hypothetical protein
MVERMCFSVETPQFEASGKISKTINTTEDTGSSLEKSLEKSSMDKVYVSTQVL